MGGSTGWVGHDLKSPWVRNQNNGYKPEDTVPQNDFGFLVLFDLADVFRCEVGQMAQVMRDQADFLLHTGGFSLCWGQEGRAVAVPLFRVFIAPHVDLKLRCDGSAQCLLVPVTRLRSSFDPYHSDERLLISAPVVDCVIRINVRPLGRPAYILGANPRTAASAPSHGVFSPRAWARASSKGSDPCGPCLSLVLGLRTHILRSPGGVG